MTNFIGKLEVNDTLLLTDPCYDKGTRCTEKVELPHGTYSCFSEEKDGRVSQIFIVLDEDLDVSELRAGEANGELGVDSGQLGIFNISKYRESVSKEVFEDSTKGDFPYEDWKRTYDENESDEAKFYKCCCNHTLSKQKCGVIEGVGFVSSSGYGDGCYQFRILAHPTQDRVVGLVVDFISDDEEFDY